MLNRKSLIFIVMMSLITMSLIGFTGCFSEEDTEVESSEAIYAFHSALTTEMPADDVVAVEKIMLKDEILTVNVNFELLNRDMSKKDKSKYIVSVENAIKKCYHSYSKDFNSAIIITNENKRYDLKL